MVQERFGDLRDDSLCRNAHLLSIIHVLMFGIDPECLRVSGITGKISKILKNHAFSVEIPLWPVCKSYGFPRFSDLLGSDRMSQERFGDLRHDSLCRNAHLLSIKHVLMLGTDPECLSMSGITRKISKIKENLENSFSIHCWKKSTWPRGKYQQFRNLL